MESLGATLKKLREEKGMTLKELAQTIKVREAVLAALENEEWSKLPQRIFVRGFVRAYAKAVDGNEEEILSLFDSSCPLENATISCPSFESQSYETLNRDKKKYGWIVVVIIFILVAVGLYFLLTRVYNPMEMFSGKKTTRVETTVVTPQEKVTHETVSPAKEKTPAPKSKPAESPAALGAKPATITSQGVSPSASKQKKQATASAAAPAKPAPVSKTAKTTPSTPPTNAKKPEKPSQPAPSHKDNLTITARMDTWVGLKVGGKMRKQMLLKPGQTFSTYVEKPAELLIGNAGGIDITYKGKRLENIGKPGEVVRLKLPPEKTP